MISAFVGVCAAPSYFPIQLAEHGSGLAQLERHYWPDAGSITNVWRTETKENGRIDGSFWFR